MAVPTEFLRWYIADERSGNVAEPTLTASLPARVKQVTKAVKLKRKYERSDYAARRYRVTLFLL